MITRKELSSWVNDPLGKDDDLIGIDEGGLTLIVLNSNNYLELGGIPLCAVCDLPIESGEFSTEHDDELIHVTCLKAEPADSEVLSGGVRK